MNHQTKKAYIAVLEFLGWEPFHGARSIHPAWKKGKEVRFFYGDEDTDAKRMLPKLPRLDLELMREAFLKMTYAQSHNFHIYLQAEIIAEDSFRVNPRSLEELMVNASIAQRLVATEKAIKGKPDTKPLPPGTKGDLIPEAKPLQLDICHKPQAVGTSKTLGDGGQCHAFTDGECYHANCPQVRDGEPRKTGRHCPRDTQGDDEE